MEYEGVYGRRLDRKSKEGWLFGRKYMRRKTYEAVCIWKMSLLRKGRTCQQTTPSRHLWQREAGSLSKAGSGKYNEGLLCRPLGVRETEMLPGIKYISKRKEKNSAYERRRKLSYNNKARRRRERKQKLL